MPASHPVSVARTIERQSFTRRFQRRKAPLPAVNLTRRHYAGSCDDRCRPPLLGGTRWIVILAQAAASTTVLLLVTLIALIALGRVRGRAALR
jgi:hypothetical protein